MTAPVPNSGAAIAFLLAFHPNRPWTLTAISPDRKAIETKTFDRESQTAAYEWVEKYNGIRNIYFSVNRPIKYVTKKCEREDIKEMVALHVDIDARAGEDLEAELARIQARLTTNLPPGIPKPTARIRSGGGYQALWLLNAEDAIEIGGDLAKAEDAKRYNQALELAFGADNCSNIDRIMRLVGTINLPDERKKKKGRVPALAVLEEWDEKAVYPLSMFTQAPVAKAVAPAGPLAPVAIGDAVRTVDVEELDQWNVPARVQVIMVQGHHPDEPKAGDNSRSAWQHDFTCNAVRCRVPDDRILGILLDPTWAISASVLDKANARRYAERQIAKAHEQVALDVDFEAGAEGKPRANSQKNIRIAMQKLGVTVRHDVFANRMLIDGLPGYTVLNDAAMVRLRLLIDEHFGFLPSKDFFFDVVPDAARASPFHPVRDYLDPLMWDDKKRIDNWLTVYGGAEDTPYTRAVGALFLVAAVRRVRQPGCKHDLMLVLEGEQGTNKSSALAILAVKTDWFTDDMPLDADAAKVVERLRGKWLCEAAELKGMRTGQVEHLKSFVSRQVDVARGAYQRMAEETPRQSVFCGTTNNDRYLRDDTGNRRFAPVKIVNFDLPALRRDVDQLWAEAAAREAAGASIGLDPSLWADAADQQEARRTEEPYVGVFREALGDMEGKIKTTDAWKILKIPVGLQTQAHAERMGAAMRELGWTRTKMRFGGANPDYCYAKGNAVRPTRIMVDVSSGGYIDVHYEGVHREPPPF